MTSKRVKREVVNVDIMSSGSSYHAISAGEHERLRKEVAHKNEVHLIITDSETGD
jgi:hypothetical protein